MYSFYMSRNCIDLAPYYARAKGNFDRCAAQNERLFADELGVSSDSLSVVDQSVKFEGESTSLTVEIRLSLLSRTGINLGYYCVHEDQNKTLIDEFLVFE